MITQTRPGIDCPPIESSPKLKPDLVELIKLDPRLILDIRAATPDNFTGRAVYAQPRAFLQRPAAEALRRVHDRLRAQGFGLVVFDAYRPWHVTKIFWDITPAHQKEFVADPAIGSKHNRGCAVDVTMLDLKTNRPVEMTGDYCEFTERSYVSYPGGSDEARRNRDTLITAMQTETFEVYESEWWHFNFPGWEQYPIMNETFQELDETMTTKR